MIAFYLRKNDSRVRSYRDNYLISLVDPCIIFPSNVQSEEYVHKDAVAAHFVREYLHFWRDKRESKK